MSLNHPKFFGRLAAALGFFFGVAIVSEAQNLMTPQGPTPASASGRIRLMLTLAWQGRDLEPHNLRALNDFRARFKDVSLVHLLSPAYFTKPHADTAQVRAKLRQVMQPHDQIGLLLGGWQSLTAAAGVIYRQGPTFWGYTANPGDCAVDCGLDVPVSIYPDGDLAKLFSTAVSTLEHHGFGRPVAFATEGWMAAPQVLEAGRQAGMRYDFSAVPPELLSRRIHYYPLFPWVKGLWANITPHTQPFALQTPMGGLTEMPQSLASMDYLAAKDVLAIFKEYAEIWRREPQNDLVFPLEIYQESAMRTLPLLEASLQEVFAYAASQKIALAPMELPELALPADTGQPTAVPEFVGPQQDPTVPGPTAAVTALPLAH